MTQLAIGIDVGGTKIAGGLVDPEGRILYSSKVPTPPQFTKLERDLLQLTDSLLEAVGALAEQSRSSLTIEGIGVAVPGVVDRKEGIAIGACNLPWQEFAIKELLENRYQLRTRIENDADAAALGVYRYVPEAKGIENFVFMTIGTGVGGGIILNGKLHGGEWPLAGEVGHMIIVADGPECNCGSRGCLEALASGMVIGRRGLEKAQTEQRGYLWSAFEERGGVTAADVVTGAEQGDALAQEVLREAARFLAIGMINLQRILSPEAIIVGGGVVKESSILLNYAREALPDVHPGIRPRIIHVKGGSTSGVQGAAAIVWEEIVQEDKCKKP